MEIDKGRLLKIATFLGLMTTASPSSSWLEYRPLRLISEAKEPIIFNSMSVERHYIAFPKPFSQEMSRRDFTRNLTKAAIITAVGVGTRNILTPEPVKPAEPIAPVLSVEVAMETAPLDPVPDPVVAPPEPEPEPTVPELKPALSCSTQRSWDGIASVYTTRESTNLMANTQPLNDFANTVAFMDAPLGSTLHISYPITNKSVEVEVTDRGGFKSLGRIVDLTLGVRDRLGIRGGLAPVHIELAGCPKIKPHSR
jgi:hypothetical protein